MSPSLSTFSPGAPAELCGWLVSYPKTVHYADECAAALSEQMRMLVWREAARMQHAIYFDTAVY